MNYSGLGLDRVLLRGLTPNVKYKAQVCCGTEEHFWKWGDDNTTDFQTEGDNQSHGLILDYEVTWGTSSAEPREARNRRTVVPPDHSAAVAELDGGLEHVVTVTARNSRGRGLDVSWPAHPDSSCGYAVVWTPTFARGPVDWKKLRPGEGTRVFINGIPDEQITGLRWEHAGSDVRLLWTAIPPRNRTAFVHGYVMHYHDLNAKDTDRNHAEHNVSTDNPEASSLTARDLHVGSYSFTVAALTSVGEGGANSITLTINSPGDKSIMTIAVTFSLVFVMLTITASVAYKNWTCIKQSLCPAVPKPVLVCDWLTLMEDRGHSIVSRTENYSSSSQKENVDVPQVFRGRV
ncbi:hypothetical protein CRUP_028368, partial [Coryphaenoides rupestris]